MATSQAAAAPSSHHSDAVFPTDDAHSHFHERDCNQWCCAWYVTGPFAEWGRAGGLMIDRGAVGQALDHDPRAKTVLQIRSWALIVHGVGRSEPVGAGEGGRCWCRVGQWLLSPPLKPRPSFVPSYFLSRDLFTGVISDSVIINAANSMQSGWLGLPQTPFWGCSPRSRDTFLCPLSLSPDHCGAAQGPLTLFADTRFSLQLAAPTT